MMITDSMKVARRVAPYVLPLVILAITWTLFIGPVAATHARESAELIERRERLIAIESAMAMPGDAPVVSASAPGFDRLTAADGTSQLLRELTRLSRAVGARNLFIDSTAAPTNIAPPGAPRVGGAVDADPRLALFGVPLAYSPIPVSFDATHAGIGDFLWQLRELPVLVEVRELTLASRALPPGAPTAAQTTASTTTTVRVAAEDSSTVTVTMLLFVYSRQSSAVQSSIAEGARP